MSARDASVPPCSSSVICPGRAAGRAEGQASTQGSACLPFAPSCGAGYRATGHKSRTWASRQGGQWMRDGMRGYAAVSGACSPHDWCARTRNSSRRSRPPTAARLGQEAQDQGSQAVGRKADRPCRSGCLCSSKAPLQEEGGHGAEQSPKGQSPLVGVRSLRQTEPAPRDEHGQLEQEERVAARRLDQELAPSGVSQSLDIGGPAVRTRDGPASNMC